MRAYYNYQEIPYAVSNKDEFEGNSASGVIMTAKDAKNMDYGYSIDDACKKFSEIVGRNNSDVIYVVKSYDTPIAVYNMETGNGVVSDDFHSSTTSRLQNICRRSL